jgi:hypothetical protein
MNVDLDLRDDNLNSGYGNETTGILLCRGGRELGIVNVAYLLGIDSSWRRWVEKRSNHPRDGKKTSREIWDKTTE